MKIGINIPEYYREFLEEIANVNEMHISTICGLIVENNLSFNRNAKRVPLFNRQVHISYAKKCDSGLVPDPKFEEEQYKPSMSYEDMIADLEAFKPDSED